MPTKVLIINDYAYINGGSSQVALSTAMALADQGWPITLFSAVGPVDPQLTAHGVRVVCLQQCDILHDPKRWRAVYQGIWNRKSSRLLAQELATCDPKATVVHVHGWIKSLSPSVIHAILASGLKLVCTMHDYFAACPNGGFFIYPQNRLCRHRALSPACIADNCDSRCYTHKLWRVVRQFVQVASGMPKKIKHFIFVSEFSHDILRPYLPKQAQSYLLSNPIAAEKGEPVPVAQNKIYMTVGRLSKEKGLLTLAMANQACAYPVMFVGDGEMRQQLLALCPQAQVTGWLPHDQIKTRLRQARALVFPSVCYEAAPIAVLEAQSCGVPVIASEVCAAREMIKDGVHGLWFRSGDCHDLAQKMRILQDDRTVAALGQSAYADYWAAPFTMERHLTKLQKIYQQVLHD